MLANSNRSGSVRATVQDERGAKVQSDRRSGRISDNQPVEHKLEINMTPQKIVSIDGRLQIVNVEPEKSKR
jgi:hypothetical protein